MKYPELVPIGSNADLLTSSHLLETPAGNSGSFSFQPSEMGWDMLAAGNELADDGQYIWWGADLPPKQTWLINPWEKKIETPTDAYGRVDVTKLVALGRQAVDPSHHWDKSKTRIDHLYWSQTAYERLARELRDPLPLTFRNLPPNKIMLPLEFERWKHHLTVPSDFPSLEVMRLSIDAWKTAKNLYGQIHAAVFWERRRRNRERVLESGMAKAIPRQGHEHDFDEFLVDTLAASDRGVERELKIHQRLPVDFQLITVENSAREVLSQIGFEVRYRCRDGISGRPVNFKDVPAQAA